MSHSAEGRPLREFTEGAGSNLFRPPTFFERGGFRAADRGESSLLASFSLFVAFMGR
jgi:hypothetical protein